MRFGQIVRTGIISVALAALPALAQNYPSGPSGNQSGSPPAATGQSSTDTGSPPAATGQSSTDTTRDMNRDTNTDTGMGAPTDTRTHHDYGWLGLIGLAGLIGLFRGSQRSDADIRRTGPDI